MSDSREKRIHFIFSRAVKKFQGDLALWNQYIEYAMRSKSHGRLAKIFPEALRLHPKCADLWIKASVWEYRLNQNIATARTYMQRAIRLNASARTLWIEYFRLELTRAGNRSRRPGSALASTVRKRMKLRLSARARVTMTTAMTAIVARATASATAWHRTPRRIPTGRSALHCVHERASPTLTKTSIFIFSSCHAADAFLFSVDRILVSCRPALATPTQRSGRRMQSCPRAS